ncbi:SPOSA6832_05131 [Sporobolomyces salmonicolor]|uniref:SPOSA6832_05131-mRNA-1:cds n=1 Tax=Sporidiobolus salmonicolor TaxID=5005 RepID=A0A0D6ETX3_SPOSA|nr:SPOSA6832_05131 [Sporobolomyces salmonicolor]
MPPKAAAARAVQQPLKYTTFGVVGFLNAKNVASSFAKSDNQSWFARRSNEQDWDAAREAKRRRLMGSEEELQEEQLKTGDEAVAGKVKVNVLKAAPEGGVKQPAKMDSSVLSDALAKTIVIHPGSRWLRIGRASDVAPLAIPNVIARKSRSFVPPSTLNGKGKEPELAARPGAHVEHGDTVAQLVQSVAEPGPSSASLPTEPGPSAMEGLPPLPGQAPPPAAADANGDTSMTAAGDEAYDSDASSSTPQISAAQTQIDPLSAKISSIKADLRARMRAYKLRGQGNGNSQAATYNGTVVPEVMGEEFEGDHEWTIGEGEVWVGNKAVRIPDALASGYVLRHPYHRGGFNAVGYTSQQELLGDIETLYTTVLKEEFGIDKEELKEYSAILLIPDLYDEVYVREMSDLLLRTMGFKQLCLQQVRCTLPLLLLVHPAYDEIWNQESVCATFGAGVSSACVVDIGSSLTKITCIEEGLVLPETRMVLDFGGDDITSFLFTLLMRNNFPYKEADLTKWYDWVVLEELKERSIVLSEVRRSSLHARSPRELGTDPSRALRQGDIGLNLYDFYVRHPGLVTQKYTMRMYDDCILAPYALFAPRVIDFEKKQVVQPQLWSKDVDDNVEIGAGGIVSRRYFSCASSLGPSPPIVEFPFRYAQTNAMKNSTRHLLSATSAPLTSAALAPPAPSHPAGADSVAASPAASQSGTPQLEEPPSGAFSALPALPPSSSLGVPPPSGPASTAAASSLTGSPAPEGGNGTPKLAGSALGAPAITASLSTASATPAAAPPPPAIDVRYESSKIPLDVAVVESILAAGAEERMKKVAANLLIVGGTGGIHNVGFAVESRVAPQLVARVPSLSGHVSYVPSPREIEPENLAWKGISVLSRLDAANDLWIRNDEWASLGMRAVRERAFYWA